MIEFPRITKSINLNLTPTSPNPQIFSIDPIAPSKYSFSLNNAELERKIWGLSLDLNLSIPETPFAEELSTKYLTQFETNLVVRDNEWKSPYRIYADILKRDISSDPWKAVGTISLLNRGGVPYQHSGFLRACKPLATGEVVLGNTEQIAIQLVDVGAGLARPGDRLTISGVYTEEAKLPDFGQWITNLENKAVIVHPAGTEIFNVTENVARLRLMNNGTERIWLNFGSVTGLGTGEPLIPGAGREIINNPKDIKFKGRIWGVAENSSQPISLAIWYV